MAKVLHVKQTKSSSKLTPKQAKTLKSLGLRGMGSEVVRKDLRSIRGMLNILQHMVEAQQLDAAPKKASGNRRGYKLV